MAFADPRHLILITIDTLRADYLSCNGSQKVKTPNLDRLASNGVNFQRTRSPVPLTLPAHASILTALYPPDHGVRDNGTFRLDQKAITIAETLKRHGYRTAAFVGSFVLDHRFGLDQGFDEYNDQVSTKSETLERFEAERSGGAVEQSFEKWFAGVTGSFPLFIWIHLYDPHAPYLPPEPYHSRYSSNLYAGEVVYADAIVGQIIKKIESKIKLTDSIIAVVGDHGEGLGEHQESTHSVLIYNSTLHVPMLIFAPGLLPAGTQIKDLTRTIDLAPTLLDYLGFPKNFGKGMSLRNLIEQKPHPEILAYSESLYPRLNLGWSELIGLENATHRYIEAPKPELYKTLKDAGEKQNLISTQSSIARDLKQKLQRLYNPATTKSPLDAETREKLSSLGYVSGTTQKSSSAETIDPKTKIDVWNEIQGALNLIAMQNYPSAIQKLTLLLQTEKEMPVLYDYLGSAYMQQQDWLHAEQIYRAAIQRGIDSSGFRMNLGLIYFYQKKNAQSEEELQRAISMDRLNVSAYYHLGNVFRACGEPLKALQHYKEALKINPRYVFALNGLGMSYVLLKRDNEALQSFQDAIEIDPTNPAAYFNLGLQLERMNRNQEAAVTYKKFLTMSQDQQFSAQRKKALEALKKIQTTDKN
jgi:choline-sulfatase